MTNGGTLVVGNSEEAGAIFSMKGDLINMGTMTRCSSPCTPGNTLHADRNYTGTGRQHSLKTVLGPEDEGSQTLATTARPADPTHVENHPPPQAHNTTTYY
ncbi:hypothetical protein, partial [Salmonella enterica]|uniref:hypothetical protein n=1 Tax=Salmonella enterica TaxID=28901 RepID=UPI00398C39CC